MFMFEIKGKEEEIKITLNSIKYLNGLNENGAFEFIQKALSGDLETYVDVIFAGLFHTKKGYKKEDVEEAIDEKIANEELDLATINATLYGLVSEHFFYKATLDKMFKENPEAKEELEKLMK